MEEPVQNPIPERAPELGPARGVTPPPIPPPQVGPRALPPRSLAGRLGPVWLEPLLFHIVPLLGGGLCLLLGMHGRVDADPLAVAAGSAVALLTFALSFYRCDWKWIGLELIALILGTYTFFALPMYPVLWMAASALGGGAVAYTLRKPWREADFLLWPPLVALVSFVLLVWLGSAFSLDGAQHAGAGWLNAQIAIGIVQLKQAGMDVQGQIEAAVGQEISPDLVIHYSYAGSILFIWVLLMWGAGRMARMLLGPPARHPRAALIFFQLHLRHIFILIAALILEILNGLTGLAGPEVLALPLFILFGMAAAVAGFGVVLFRAALLRARGDARQAQVLVIGVVVGLALFSYVLLPALILLGLADTWLDLRHLRALAGPLDGQSK